MRVFVEKKSGFDVEAAIVFGELREFLGVEGLRGVRVVYCFDIEAGGGFEKIVGAVLADAPSEVVSNNLTHNGGDFVFGVRLLPGQFDRCAEYTAQAVRVVAGGKAAVGFAKFYVCSGELSADERAKIKAYIINPVDCMEVTLETPAFTGVVCDECTEDTEILNGFINVSPSEMAAFKNKHGLVMGDGDLLFCQKYFKETERRDPTVTEMRVLETYWSDHCRHSTFLTEINEVTFDDGAGAVKAAFDLYMQKRKEVYGNVGTPYMASENVGTPYMASAPISLMNIAVMGMKALRREGLLDDLDESEEVNACSINVVVTVNGKDEQWLLMFKNETHNHPTEIEPWGGAHTCLGGAIRDPLSGRSYVYQAMRVTGSGDPRTPFEQTMPGKLPQRKITTAAAQGYSAYGNLIGGATGHVTEIYHEGYLAKRMELGALVAAAKKEHVRREKPANGDAVILLGARTGRDGCGGATVSSDTQADESAAADSMKTAGMEVPKGDPPVERKIVRLFRNPNASLLIKRCNDFGAGGVSVAVGELAEGLDINLDKVLTKYNGLNGTELAISESQERMAVVVAEKDVKKFISLANGEGLEAAVIANVTDKRRLVMKRRGKTIVDISRDFLDTNGAKQTASVHVAAPKTDVAGQARNDGCSWLNILTDINVASQKGLVERFDSTVGGGTVLMPLGGKYQLTPAEVMAAKVPVFGHTETATVMSFGFNPVLSSQSPFHGAACAVIEAVAKAVAAGCDYKRARLSLQEYFERLGNDPKRWGKPFSALLGAFWAQMKLGLPAIGGKDSMSGTYKDIDVPPTLVAFAVNYEKSAKLISGELKSGGNTLAVLQTPYREDGLPDFDALAKNFEAMYKLIQGGTVVSAYTVGVGGLYAALPKMAFGNKIGFTVNTGIDLCKEQYGSFVLEIAGEGSNRPYAVIGQTVDNGVMEINGEKLGIDEAVEQWTKPLECVFPSKSFSTAKDAKKNLPIYSVRSNVAPAGKTAEPRVFIPVLPGTHGEYELEKSFSDAGAFGATMSLNMLPAKLNTEIFKMAADMIKDSQILALPGGCSFIDEPDGLGKLAVNFFKNPYIKEAVEELLHKKGLIIGVGTGFQLLLRLGLIPHGEYREMTDDSPILAANAIGRHISTIAQVKVVSTLSPWLALSDAGAVYSAAVSTGEGRFVANDALITELANNGQIAAQFADCGNIEAAASPNGLVLGKLSHPERCAEGLFKNVPGDYERRIFEAGVKYFR